MSADVLAKWGRRIVSITLCAALCVVAVLGFPVLIGVAALVDLLRGGNRAATVRCAALATIYLLCEVGGLAACLALWVASPLERRGVAKNAEIPGPSDRYLAAHFRLQCRWARVLFQSASRLFGMRTVVEGDDVVRAGPFVLFSRHASVGDTLLPAVFVAATHGIRLRHVMKRELLWDPCLDVVGNRLPNYCIRRGSGDSGREIAGLQGLMEHLGSRDAVLIFPEGTFFTPAERARVIARLPARSLPLSWRRWSRYATYCRLRLGGPLALLECNASVDAVFCAHTGFEAAGSFWRDLPRLADWADHPCPLLARALRGNPPGPRGARHLVLHTVDARGRLDCRSRRRRSPPPLSPGPVPARPCASGDRVGEDLTPTPIRTRIPYAAVCTIIGFAIGWLPILVHGPIPEKYNVLYIRGAIAVWGWYTARLLIGFVVGITHWPPRWYLRGPLIGFLMLFPLSLVSLATPGCGPPCMCLNLITATVIGSSVAGIAYALTGLHCGN